MSLCHINREEGRGKAEETEANMKDLGSEVETHWVKKRKLQQSWHAPVHGVDVEGVSANLR